MNIFFVGNGFDLHHKFPTSYINFLHVTQFLIENYDDTYAMVASVLGNKELYEKDLFIRDCYDKHSRIYESTLLEKEKISVIIENAKKNIWFNYLCNCVTKDIRWIDFEKEILRVIEAFNAFFNTERGLYLVNKRITFDISCLPPNKEDQYILQHFNFFFERVIDDRGKHLNQMWIKTEYQEEQVVGSKSYHISTSKIVSKLYLELRELADILRDYLLYFVDAPSKEYANHKIKPTFRGMPTPNRVYSFNYTNTFEILYGNPMIDHIHGNTNSNIVLGINPDEKDEVCSVDTTFLQFKKYFQRVFFKTDVEFLNNMMYQKRIPRSLDNHVWVIGHSLDTTDEDIIKQVFDSAKEITVLYHEENKVKDYITHLVEIYGKQGLDFLREEKNLMFMPQAEIDWTYFVDN